MFKALIGDLFESRLQTLVNPVNCVGVMGKGLALEFKKRFPAMFNDYVERCENREVQPGQPYLYRDPSGAMIVNFPTKGHWRSQSSMRDIAVGLDYLAGHVGAWEITSIALPALGCGNGGLSWDQVGPLIYRKLHDESIETVVFAPAGTPPSELAAEFLSGPVRVPGKR